MGFILDNLGIISGIAGPVIGYIGYRVLEKQIKETFKEIVDVLQAVVALGEAIREARKDGKYDKDEIKLISNLIEEMMKQIGELLAKSYVLILKIRAKNRV